MKKILIYSSVFLSFLLAAALAYAGKGWLDAKNLSQDLKSQAQKLIENNRGGDALGEERLKALIKVQDPGFYQHEGVDLSSPGAGVTTLTQSLSKRLGFEDFKPGIDKIRQTGFAVGLDQELSKEEQIALFLETVEMGPSKEGWVTGFFKASQTFYGSSPDKITDEEFYSLVAVMIAPSRLKLNKPDEMLQTRVARIERLVSNECQPIDLTDVWLDGCA